jgi:uncharacterized protein (TIGR02265 family)
MDTERTDTSQVQRRRPAAARLVHNGGLMPAARLAAATKDDTIRGLAFNAAFDVVREHADEATVLLCDPTGRGKRADFSSYAVTDLLQVVWAVADRLERKLGGPEEAFFQIGYRATAGVLGSMLGTTLLAFGRTPRALLSQVPTAFKATTGYGQRFITWEGDAAARLDFDHEFLPLAYLRGTIQAGLDAAGAKQPRVEGHVPGFMKATFQVRWT